MYVQNWSTDLHSFISGSANLQPVVPMLDVELEAIKQQPLATYIHLIRS